MLQENGENQAAGYSTYSPESHTRRDAICEGSVDGRLLLGAGSKGRGEKASLCQPARTRVLGGERCPERQDRPRCLLFQSPAARGPMTQCAIVLARRGGATSTFESTLPSNVSENVRVGGSDSVCLREKGRAPRGRRTTATAKNAGAHDERGATREAV